MRRTFLILLGATLGFALAVPLMSFYQGAAIDYLIKVGVLLICGIAAVAVIFLLGFNILNRFAKRKLGIEKYSAESIAARTIELAWEVARSDISQAKETSAKLATELVSFVSITTFYRWIFGTILTMIVALGGTVGTMVLVKQNEKLDEQTAVAREQAALAAQQLIRSKSQEFAELSSQVQQLKADATTAEFARIAAKYLNKGAKEVASCWQSSADSQHGLVVSSKISARAELVSVAALNALDGARGGAQHMVALRSRLLRILANSGIPFSLFSEGYFDGLYLYQSNLENANLDGAYLDGGDLSYANLTGLCAERMFGRRIKAIRSNLSRSQLTDPYWHEVNFQYSNFADSAIRGSEFQLFDVDQAVGDGDSAERWRIPRREIDRSPFQRIRNTIEAFLRATWHRLFERGDVYGYYEQPPVNGALFHRSDFRAANFANATLDTVRIVDSDLRATVFNNAKVRGQISFALSNLSHSDFRIMANKEVLSTTNFEQTILENAAVDGIDFGNNPTLTADQLGRACSCSGAEPVLRNRSIKVASCRTVSLSMDHWFGIYADPCQHSR